MNPDFARLGGPLITYLDQFETALPGIDLFWELKKKNI